MMKSLLTTTFITFLSQSFSFMQRPNRASIKVDLREGCAPTLQNSHPEDGMMYSVELPKRPGISWGSDLSFRWIYVLDIDSNSEGRNFIRNGDYLVAVGNTSVVGEDFDFVLTTISKQTLPLVNYSFFRGKKEQLIGGKVQDPRQSIFIIKVKESGKADRSLQFLGHDVLFVCSYVDLLIFTRG
jgi:hypothetical protein